MQLVNNYQRNVSAAGEREERWEVIFFFFWYGWVGNKEGGREINKEQIMKR